MNPQNTRVIPNHTRFLSCPIPTPEQCAALEITPQDAHLVRLIDTKTEPHLNPAVSAPQTLNLFHFLIPATADNVPKYDQLKSVGHVAGTILDQDNNKICVSMPYIAQSVTVPVDLASASICEAYEGPRCRVFYWNGQWRWSTEEKIDGTKSRRGESPLFYDVFMSLWPTGPVHVEGMLPSPFNILSMSASYTFVICAPVLRFILPVPKPQLVFIQAFDYTSQQLIIPNVSKYPDQGIEGITSPRFIDSTDIDAVIAEPHCAGLYIIPMSDVDAVHLITQQYKNLIEARGDEFTVKARYSHVWGTPQAQLLRDYYPTPEITAELDLIDNVITKELPAHMMFWLATSKEGKQIPQEEYRVVSAAKRNSKGKQITEQAMLEQLKKIDNADLTKIINRYKNHKKYEERHNRGHAVQPTPV